MAAPHDDFFHFVFQHARHAAAWLGGLLPEDLARAIDLTTLTPAPEKLRGHTLRLGVADLVFSAALRTGQPLWFVVEHKAQDDAAVEAQVLRYVVHLRDRSPKPGVALPMPVAPVLFHHGDAPFRRRQPTWHPLLHCLRPTMRLFVDDCSTIAEHDLRGRRTTPLGTLALLCLRFLRHWSGEHAAAAFESWSDLLRAADRDESPPSGRDAMMAIGEYALRTVDLPALDLHFLFERLLHRREDTIMSTADKLRREGRAEGRVEGRVEALIRLIQRRFGPPSADLAERVRRAPIAELDRWTDRILECGTLTELFAD